MGKIVVSDNVSLDGVVQDPAGDEGFEHGGRVGRQSIDVFLADDRFAQVVEQTKGAR